MCETHPFALLGVDRDVLSSTHEMVIRQPFRAVLITMLPHAALTMAHINAYV